MVAEKRVAVKHETCMRNMNDGKHDPIHDSLPLQCMLYIVVNGSQSNRGKQQFNYLRLSVVDLEYFSSSTVCQRFVIE